MKEILFRAKPEFNGSIYEGMNDFLYGFYYHLGKHVHHLLTDNGNHIINVETLGQYTGLKDSSGTRIFEGDILEIRKPGRLHQEHVGDNIPNGIYTEQLEPFIKVERRAVSFKKGMFAFDDESNEYDSPLCWEVFDYQSVKPTDLAWMFESSPSCWPEDLEYLCEEYNVVGEEGLRAYMGVWIIGNVYDHKWILEGK